MATNQQKLPLSRTIPTLAQRKVRDAMQIVGKNLPCSITAVNPDGTVTVKFELQNAPFALPETTMSVAQAQYARLPLQLGDKGVARAADIYIGGVTNLGGGVADLSQRANLATLVFDPVADAQWTPVPNPNQYDLSGPQGVNIHDTGNQAIVNIGTAGISMTFGGHSLIIGSGGVTIDGRIFLVHEHSGVTPGAGDSGPVV